MSEKNDGNKSKQVPDKGRKTNDEASYSKRPSRRDGTFIHDKSDLAYDTVIRDTAAPPDPKEKSK